MKQEYSVVMVKCQHIKKLDLNMSEKLDLEIKEKGPKRKRIRKTLGSYCAAINCHNARRNSK